MSISLKQRFTLKPRDTFDDGVWNAFVEEVSLLLATLNEKSASFDEARQQLIQAALFRVNEILLPAFASVESYQTGGFLSAPIADATEVPFSEGPSAVVIHPDNRANFWPSPFVALTRASTSADVAIAQAGEYNSETGALPLTIVAVIGGGGTFADVIVSATAGSVMAQHAFLTDAKSARDLAKDWAEKPDGQNVAGAGTRSAKHHAGVAAGHVGTVIAAAGTAITKAGEASDSADAAALARDKAQDWAEKAEDAAVEAGQYSAKHHAAKAAASALAAAAFDLSEYYTKTQLDDPTTGKADKSDLFSGSYNDLSNKPSLFDGNYSSLSGTPTLGNAAAKDTGTTAGTVAAGDDSRITGAAQKSANLSDLGSAATAFGNIKQTATDSATGVVEIATASEVRSGAAGALAVTPAGISSALALTTPSGGTNFAPDWSGFTVADWNVTANRTLSNPTNVVVGSTRYVFIRASSGTRTITFGSNFKGNLPTLNDVTSSKWYLLSLVAYSSTHIVVTAVDASP